MSDRLVVKCFIFTYNTESLECKIYDKLPADDYKYYLPKMLSGTRYMNGSTYHGS